MDGQRAITMVRILLLTLTIKYVVTISNDADVKTMMAGIQETLNDMSKQVTTNHATLIILSQHLKRQNNRLNGMDKHVSSVGGLEERILNNQLALAQVAKDLKDVKFELKGMKTMKDEVHQIKKSLPSLKKSVADNTTTDEPSCKWLQEHFYNAKSGFYWTEKNKQLRDEYCTMGVDHFTLDKAGAIDACDSMGWTVGWIHDVSLICTAPGTSHDDDCNSCDTWRLLVWEDGGRDRIHGGEKYYTKAGRAYGGHSPCKQGWSLQSCPGTWTQNIHE